MPADRFRFIEGANGPLPEDLKRTLGNLGRFGNLELSLNDPGALECKSCRRVFEPEAKVVPAGADLALVLDGQTYKSNDPNLPEDIKVLMKQIREKGYTPKLVADWRSWRATRRSRKAASEPTPSKPAPVLRINGRLLRWSDPDLPDELKILFSFIAANGVTNALIAHLKELGYGINYDPNGEGGLGLLEVRTDSTLLLGLRGRALTFLLVASVVWILMTPLRNLEAMPDYLRTALYLIPIGMGLTWASRR
jgi:hypothetical protein